MATGSDGVVASLGASNPSPWMLTRHPIGTEVCQPLRPHPYGQSRSKDPGSPKTPLESM